MKNMKNWQKIDKFLLCLQGAGVDNWSGYDYARDDYRETYGEN